MRTIFGPVPNEGIADGIAVDSAGKIYIANSELGSSCSGSITVYPAAPNGNVAPVAIITGRKTGLWHPAGIAVSAIRVVTSQR